ncbi:MAG: RluA family pseudouridine synthase [Thermoflexales bacterium]
MPLIQVRISQPDRLDRTLATLVPALSRSQIQRLIAAGRVTVDGVAREASFRPPPGAIVTLDVPDPAPSRPQPEALPLEVLYADADVWAINKPAGMVVHPGAGAQRGTLVNALLAHDPALAQVGDPLRPGIVHRLDKETSGVLIVARTVAALQALQSQFKSRQVQKSYVALCCGSPSQEMGAIQLPIARHPRHRRRMAIVAGGRTAITRVRLLRAYGRYSLVLARPITGRTHQIRVHLAAMGLPIVGDALYGSRRDALSRSLAPRHLLHALSLAFYSPSTGEQIMVRAPLPADFKRVLRQVRDAASA